METQIKAGDCVQLKYGISNMKMVVDEIFEYREQTRATCKWFSEKEGKFLKDAFNIDALKKCDDANG